MTVTTRNEKRLTNKNGAAVHGFMGEMSNLGMPLMGERILAMLNSGVWRSWKDGLGRVELLPGEFDYFLSMCGITPSEVKGLNPDVLCALDEHMDEREVTQPGEKPNGYRRRYLEVMAAVGGRHGAAPWVMTLYEKAEARAATDANGQGVALANGEDDTAAAEPLGHRVRRRRRTGDWRAAHEKRPRAERLATSVAAPSAGEDHGFQRLR